MSTSPDSQRSKCSYDNESFETAEESLVDDGKSSPVVWGRQESVFLAESSSSSPEELSLGQGQKSRAFSERSTPESYETIISESIAESENIYNITEECDYSDQFESVSLLSEEEFSKKDESVGEAQENERQDNFIRRKLAVLSSRQSDSKTENFKEQNEDGKWVGCNERNNFCSRKLQIVAMNRYSSDSQQCKGQHALLTDEQPVKQPVAGNKRKIESLKIENMINKTEKLIKHKDYHDPRHCSDCRSMKSNIAKTTFLKRKAEIVKRSELEDRLQMHLYQKDSATLIAEIVNSCTKATAPASEVWEKFLNKGGNK